MENKINIAELLKDCPKGMELDCTMYDNLYFDSLNADYYGTINCYTLIDGIKTSINFTKYGTFNNYTGAKCVIFPKGKTTWEGFHRPFKDGDVVATGNGLFIGIVEVKNNIQVKAYCAIGISGSFSMNIAYGFERFATEEEKQKLFDAIKANGYKWNPDNKVLEKLIKPKFKVGDVIKTVFKPYKYTVIKITNTHYTLEEVDDKFIYVQSISNQYNWELVPNKFDINTLVPFESRVLVRDSDYGEWKGSFWSHLRQGADIKYDTIRGVYRQCIPYNDDTKHLLGKTNDCSEFYKNWK